MKVKCSSWTEMWGAMICLPFIIPSDWGSQAEPKYMFFLNIVQMALDPFPPFRQLCCGLDHQKVRKRLFGQNSTK